MTEPLQDPLWPEFRPLWHDLRQAGGTLSVAGGYGLFLKQRYLLENAAVLSVVATGDWIDANPRTTGDMDLIVGLDLIGDREAHAMMVAALTRAGFNEAAQEKHRRWRWEKPMGGDKRLLVELHTPPATLGQEHIRMDKIRVKHKPSLGLEGVHGRQNAEAVGCERHPFRFNLEGIEIAVPNPVTMCIMKLTAMDDYWTDADDPERDPERRRFFYGQATKHAGDVFRAVAMMTREEAAQIDEVLAAVRGSVPFDKACEIYHRYFADPQGRGRQVVGAQWRPEDAQLIVATLDRWFGVSA